MASSVNWDQELDRLMSLIGELAVVSFDQGAAHAIGSAQRMVSARRAYEKAQQRVRDEVNRLKLLGGGQR